LVFSITLSKRRALTFSQVAVGAGHQGVQHFDDIDARAERRVNGSHLQPDDAAADDQHALRDSREQQRAGGVDDARVFGHEGQLHRLRTGGDDCFGKLDDSLAGRLAAGVPQFDLEVIRIEK
jgi:hypothetical protein